MSLKKLFFQKIIFKMKELGVSSQIFTTKGYFIIVGDQETLDSRRFMSTWSSFWNFQKLVVSRVLGVLLIEDFESYRSFFKNCHLNRSLNKI